MGRRTEQKEQCTPDHSIQWHKNKHVKELFSNTMCVEILADLHFVINVFFYPLQFCFVWLFLHITYDFSQTWSDHLGKCNDYYFCI